MSQLIYTMLCTCRGCDHTQTVEVQLPDGFSDADLRNELGNAVECTSCYEIDWMPLLKPEAEL